MEGGTGPRSLPTEERASALAWSWREALVGASYTVPAAIVAVGDPTRGVALALGVLPAAIVGLPARRRSRLVIPVLGVLTGVPILIGGLLAGVPVLAVAAIVALALGAVVLARNSRLGQIAMVLSLPMVGIGLSYPEVGKAAGAAGLMITGSIYACAVSMLWPEEPPPPRRSSPPAATLDYGLRLGAAGGSAAAIGFIFDLDHVGWATAAALLVMRPVAEMQRLRSVGRIVSVLAGALAAICVLHLEPGGGWIAATVVVTIAAAAATRGSRWYVTPTFTTFLVFLLLLYANPGDSRWRFDERLLETAVGVGLAYFFGLLLPTLSRSGKSAP